MKKMFLVLLTTLLATMQLYAQTWQWTKPEPNGNLTPNSEHDDAHDVEVDASGNAYVLGDYLGSLFLNDSLRATGSGSYLAKYDSTGLLLWYKLITPTSASGYIKATDLTINTQGVFITGKYSPTYNSTYTYNIGSFSFVSDVYEVGVFVTKLDTTGMVTWNKLVTGAPYVSSASYNPLITSDKNNNIVCEFLYTHNQSNLTSLGIGGGTIPLPLPVANVYNNTCIVFKMNDTGALLWSNYAAEQERSATLNNCNSIISDNNGNIFLLGIANDGCAFGSNIFHTTEYLRNGNRSWSTYIAKISATGAWEFVRELNNFGQNILELGFGNPDKLAVDNINNVYAIVYAGGNGVYGIVTGDTVPVDKTSTYLVKLGNSGNLIWHKGFGSNETRANSICFANNALYISGRLSNFVYGGKLWYFSDLQVQPSSPNYGGTFEWFNSKTNTDGVFQWVSPFSGDPAASSFADGNAIKAFNNNIYTAGYYRGKISSLGNLNGNYTGNASINNQFFGKLKDQYIRVGAISAKQVMPGCSISIPFTSTGLTFSAKNKFNAELSNASGDFTTPTIIGSVKSTGTGSINAIVPTTLAVGTSGYKIRIRSTDTLLTGFNYFAYADTGYTLTIACPGVASGQNTTNITGTTATLNWAAVGCAAGYKIQYRVKGTTAWTTQNTTASVTNLALTGLTINTTYQWRMATKCKNGTTTSFSAYSPNQQFKTAAAFTQYNQTANAASANSIQLLIQPNPATSNAVMVINGAVKNATVTITDFVGKTVWKKDGVNTGQLVLPVQNFAAGIYLVKLQNGTATSMVKLIKE